MFRWEEHSGHSCCISRRSRDPADCAQRRAKGIGRSTRSGSHWFSGHGLLDKIQLCVGITTELATNVRSKKNQYDRSSLELLDSIPRYM